MNAAAAYPNRPIRIFVPGAAGGPGDIIAHVIGQKLSGTLGQQVIIDSNQNPNIALKAAASSEPDGYTLVMGGGSFYINASLYRKLPFDSVKDFVPVTLVASIANVLVVHPSVPVRSVTEFIAYAKSHPGQLKYGSSGHGSPPHLAGEMFRTMAGVDITHVPYNGHVAAGNALCEGRELQVMFDAVPTAISHLKAGELRGLAVTTAQRLTILPEMPTIAECGLPAYELNPAMGILAPTGTPDEIVMQLSVEIANIMRLLDVQTRLQSIGIEAISTTRDHFAAYMQGEFAKWAKMLKDAGIKTLESPTLDHK